ncbi:minor tail protein [Microbacterium phage MementoMori]|uniref:Minor tail protein n=2 Tax=Mementomorivirus TaxID=2733194 RepID=A0A2Z4Q694_9CAUD|nr:minor tail protein [Microbacterium phage MementoMori]AWY05289.1 minor tail protein [Microbacterium phage MementoMori]
MMAVIGQYGEPCVAGHRALIFDRGGARKKHTLVDLASVEWGRARDEKTQAIVKVTGQSCDAQTTTLQQIEPHRHELVLFRGGGRVWDRVWEGPIEEVATQSDNAQIMAYDVLHYLDNNPLSKDWPLETGTPVSESSALMTERVRAILEHELVESYDMVTGTGGATQTVTVPRWDGAGMEPPANVFPYLDIRFSDSLLTRSSTLAFEMMIGEHLSNLAEGGLDFTVIGRSLIIWDSAKAIGRTRTLTESDFYGDPRVIASGSRHAAIGHVSAQRAEETDPDVPVAAAVGNAGASDPYYGPWTTLASLASEEGSDDPTQDELNSQAQRTIVGRNPVPIEVRMPDGAGLRLSHDLTINHLVPGTVMPLLARLNLRRLSQDQRLDRVKVTETAEGEAITVTLSPAGTATEVAA